jgi:diketogulonate reductase-like aldo/keto reductase/HEAT repeat protein
MISGALLSEDRRLRLEAAREVELDSEGIYALRGALVLDEDGEVRAVAAERLALVQVVRANGPLAVAVPVALLDALDDTSPMVREHAAIALGRHFEGGGGDGAVRPLVEARLREMTRVEPMWRVRRVVVRALAAAAGRGAVTALCEVLDEPFWRVRYAAIQALAAWPDCEGALLDAPRSSRREAAIAFLRTLWRGERPVDDEPLEPEPSPDPGAPLDDEDPAVVAVRLARLPEDQLDGRRLVPLLASPHDVLRRLAIKRLLARPRGDELGAALALLEEPRTPYVGEAVRRMLARADTQPLRAAILAGAAAGPEALVWAFDSARGDDDVGAIAGRQLAHPDVRVRRAAARAANDATETDALLRALDDADELVRAGALAALASRKDIDAVACEALERRDLSREAPRVGRALVAAFCRDLGEPDQRAVRVVTRGLDAWDPATRAAAVEVLRDAGLLHGAQRDAFVADPDPWLRLAAIDASSALAALEQDPDPSVRRGAFEVLSRGRRSPPATAIEAAAASDDPWLRARAATAYARAGGAIDLLLRLTRDRAPMVRAAAAESLARRDDAPDACMALVTNPASIDEELLLAAHGRLVQESSPEAFAALEQDLERRELSAGARRSLVGMAQAYPTDVTMGRLALSSSAAPSPSPPTRPARAARRRLPPVERRRLGKSGLDVAPLAISGAFELPVSCLARARDAGVNAFFWEPEYRAMSEFLARSEDRDQLVVIAGSYEADAKTITRDVDRALKRLRRDTLGAMLLFWVRSPARLSDESFGALARLKEAGKVRAIGFSTHLRDLAATAIAERPWDIVMTRHSAAHPGIETALLPVSRERDVGIITFSALVYSRMLAPDAAGVRLDAADCYRYSLSQQGVGLCLSAPRRQRELEQNLAVLRTPTLDVAMQERLRSHGARVRSDNRAFRSLVRRS